MKNSEFLEVAKKAAVEAGKIISGYLGKKINITAGKYGTQDFATKADKEADKVISSIISKAFPDHNIVSEESTDAGKASSYTWLVDPLDGTVSFMAGMPAAAVSIALLKDGHLVLGVVNRLLDKELYWSQKGKGVFMNGKRIQVSKVSKLNLSVLAAEFYYNQREKDFKRFKPILNQVRYMYILGGPASTLALVSKGTLEGYLHRASHWDFAAGAALIEEAGGKVTDLKGKPVDWTNDKLEILATNGVLHNLILKELKR